MKIKTLALYQSRGYASTSANKKQDVANGTYLNINSNFLITFKNNLMHCENKYSSISLNKSEWIDYSIAGIGVKRLNKYEY